MLRFNWMPLHLFDSNTSGHCNQTEALIDILVSFKKPIGWAFFDLQDFLEEEQKLKVDLLSEKVLKEQLT